MDEYRSAFSGADDGQTAENTSPKAALQQIRQKLEQIAREYSEGKLNSAQFNALYRHYSEKRTIIEKLIERNPETDAWRNVASAGMTSVLRDRFEARALYYVVFRRGNQRPLISGGKIPKKAAEQLHRLLRVIWSLQQWRVGLARKSMGEGTWLLLMMGEQSASIVVYFMQPSTLDANKLRDLHTDFEEANRLSLQRGEPAERMVFPQRALLE